MFGGKWTHVKSDQVVISKEEYERLLHDSNTLKRLYRRIAMAVKKKRITDE